MRQAFLAATVALGACTAAPEPRSVDIVQADKSWLEHAKPLPDVPKCDQKTDAARAECDARYQTAVRKQYVALAVRHNALADYEIARGGR
jgi:hypothetical protein